MTADSNKQESIRGEKENKGEKESLAEVE